MRWVKDPLVVFVLVGAIVFIGAEWLAEDDIPYTINLSEPDIQRLSDQWQLQMQRPPTVKELRGLIDQFIKEEIYYREAQRLGLDNNDTIVRRRMVQKLTFLTEDIATARPAEAEALQDYYEQHIDDYRLPPRLSFRHRYFSIDRRDNAEADARSALRDPAVKGDPFMLQREYAQRNQREIGDLFGRDFAAHIMTLEPADSWQGPVKSAYGWHTVMVTAAWPASTEPYQNVADRVASDFQQTVRAAANAAYYEDLRARYQINLPQADAVQ